MKVIVCTSASKKIVEYASLTIPHTAAYCLRHGYSHMVLNEPYEEAVGSTAKLVKLFHMGFDLIWCIDADCVITAPEKPIHTLECLGPDVTVCEEGIVAWNKINCGSMVWRKSRISSILLQHIALTRDLWERLPCGWQTYLQDEALKPHLTIAPLRSFNSCEWNAPAGGSGAPGSHWQPGDFVYHPCGVFPIEERTDRIRRKLTEVTA